MHVSYRQGKRQKTLMNAPQLLLLLFFHWLGFRVLYRFGYGPLGKIGFALSPGMAWSVPFYLALICRILLKGAVRSNKPHRDNDISLEEKSE